MIRKIVILWLITTSLYAQPGLITKVITLNYIKASEAERALKPMLEPKESISYSNQQLILNVSQNTLTKIRTVLQRIDVLPVIFNVYIHQDDAGWLNRNQQQDAVSYSTSSQSTRGDDQMVQVESGHSALVSTGSNVPVVSSAGIGLWQSGVSYQRLSVSQGFLIQPSLQGARVQLKIRRFNSQVDHINQQAANTNYTDTTTIILQDKWVQLGSAGHAELGQDDQSYSFEAGNSFKDKQTVYIKVKVVETSPDNNEQPQK